MACDPSGRQSGMEKEGDPAHTPCDWLLNEDRWREGMYCSNTCRYNTVVRITLTLLTSSFPQTLAVASLGLHCTINHAPHQPLVCLQALTLKVKGRCEVGGVWIIAWPGPHQCSDHLSDMGEMV